MTLTKPIYKKEKKAQVKVNKDLYRIGKQDERNFTIEVLTKSKKADVEPKWNVAAYYGNVEDMVWGLIKMSVGIPKHADLIEQVKLLRQELKEMEKNIVAQLKETVEVGNES